MFSPTSVMIIKGHTNASQNSNYEKTVTHNPILYTTMIIFLINTDFYEASLVVMFNIVLLFIYVASCYPCYS